MYVWRYTFKCLAMQRFRKILQVCITPYSPRQNSNLPFKHKDKLNLSEKKDIWDGGHNWWITSSKINIENKNEIKAHGNNSQELWRMITITRTIIYGIWKEAGINTRDIGNLVNQITEEIFLNLKKKP